MSPIQLEYKEFIGSRYERRDYRNLLMYLIFAPWIMGHLIRGLGGFEIVLFTIMLLFWFECLRENWKVLWRHYLDGSKKRAFLIKVSVLAAGALIISFVGNNILNALVAVSFLWPLLNIDVLFGEDRDFENEGS